MKMNGNLSSTGPVSVIGDPEEDDSIDGSPNVINLSSDIIAVHGKASNIVCGTNPGVYQCRYGY